ncbi:hypothetical protein Nepgr_023797 [Nepenthes gracilis]|uniref:Uncharacterized protein n=1 Tax=Nepenthes gracilis TaxID=150966 RepID=A0AAD3T3E8_NEPGR|nr:hypothetical protein Nepgr_023797 [Nepenthes gracilis]
MLDVALKGKLLDRRGSTPPNAVERSIAEEEEKERNGKTNREYLKVASDGKLLDQIGTSPLNIVERSIADEQEKKKGTTWATSPNTTVMK